LGCAPVPAVRTTNQGSRDCAAFSAFDSFTAQEGRVVRVDLTWTNARFDGGWVSAGPDRTPSGNSTR
jgi:hypothetical protein